jgi:hypothetical protein
MHTGVSPRVSAGTLRGVIATAHLSPKSVENCAISVDKYQETGRTETPDSLNSRLRKRYTENSGASSA